MFYKFWQCFLQKHLQIILTGVMLSLTKRREGHGILAGNENSILGCAACPVFAPHRGLRQGKRCSHGRNEKPHHRKPSLAGRYHHMGSALGQSPYNTAPFVPLRYMHPRAVGFTYPNTSRQKILIFTLPHTTEALAQAWAGCFNAATAQGYAIDFGRPIMERYVKKEVDKHHCDLCLPII